MNYSIEKVEEFEQYLDLEIENVKELLEASLKTLLPKFCILTLLFSPASSLNIERHSESSNDTRLDKCFLKLPIICLSTFNWFLFILAVLILNALFSLESTFSYNILKYIELSLSAFSSKSSA